MCPLSVGATHTQPSRGRPAASQRVSSKDLTLGSHGKHPSGGSRLSVRHHLGSVAAIRPRNGYLARQMFSTSSTRFSCRIFSRYAFSLGAFRDSSANLIGLLNDRPSAASRRITEIVELIREGGRLASSITFCNSLSRIMTLSGSNFLIAHKNRHWLIDQVAGEIEDLTNRGARQPCSSSDVYELYANGVAGRTKRGWS